MYIGIAIVITSECEIFGGEPELLTAVQARPNNICSQYVIGIAIQNDIMADT